METKVPKKREARHNQKLKLLYLLKILQENTDENHSITMNEIIVRLQEHDVTAERKSIYDDIDQLRSFGLDIIGEQLNRTYYYKLISRQFELPELKLLVDTVQAAKFITPKKSEMLIRKIESLASKYDASQLHRQVYVTGRNKSQNESIYYNVDSLHKAIGENKRITFQYFSWTVDKKPELRHNGKKYDVSPWALLWDDENYYLLAYDSGSREMRHYRVEKMKNIEITDKKRDGADLFAGYDMSEYTDRLFGMFDGELQDVSLLCNNAMAGVFIDRFGTDVSMTPCDDNHFKVNIRVAASRHFLSWIIALGPGVRIISPDSVIEQMRDEIRRLASQYKE